MPEPFQFFQSHKESLNWLYEWEKKLYEEVKAEECVRLSYDKKCAYLRSQDANGMEPFAFKRTRAAIRTSGPSSAFPSRRVVAVRNDELLQLAELIRGLARMWRVIGDGATDMLLSCGPCGRSSRLVCTCAIQIEGQGCHQAPHIPISGGA